MKCQIENCHKENGFTDIGKCIVCGKWICYDLHAEVLFIKINIQSDCGLHEIDDGDHGYELYYCFDKNKEIHTKEEVKKALKRIYILNWYIEDTEKRKK